MSSPSKDKKYQDYYTEDDYNKVLAQLPDIVKMASDKAQEVMEPTIYEKKEVTELIYNFIKIKKRKIYGGTAMNAILKESNPKECFYAETEFADIDFYSPKPVFDLVELTNQLYEKGYKFVQGREAQHDESFSIYVNMHLYCQISYVPTRVYMGIQTININGLLYTHPHFMYIDQLRMFNDPMNSAWRWEKAFKRTYLLLKYYPFEYYNKKIQIKAPLQPVLDYVQKIKNEYMMLEHVQTKCMISGFDAYNFFIKHAANDNSVEKMARTNYNTSGNRLLELLVIVPYMELISVNYKDTVKTTYQFLQKIVDDKTLLSVDEYFPLFQFMNHMVVIKYSGQPIVKIYESDGMCVSMLKTTKGYSYVSYQYLLMFTMINKFRAHLDENKEMYFDYSTMLSNLIKARNIYLSGNNLNVINNTVFGEFKISCMGTTMSFLRAGQIRRMERLSKGHAAQFTYEPKRFLDKTIESPPKFEPTKTQFRNTAGNIITKPKFLMFGIDKDGNIFDKSEIEEYDTESDKDSEIETNKE